jgi:hypothetical protein
VAHSAISQHVAALKGVPSQSTAAAVRPVVKPGYRLVPALVGRSTDPGTVVYVECPVWCTVDHVADRSVFLEDINHQGERAAMSLSPSRGDRVPVEVYLSEWPASSSDDGRPHLAVDVDYEVSNYSRPAALALADQLAAFAENVRRLAETLPVEGGRS